METLILDPYAIYARQILNLVQLNSLAPLPDNLVRGMLQHRVFERLLSEGEIELGDDEFSRLVSIAAEEFEAGAPSRWVERTWYFRLANIAQEFLVHESVRRKIAKPCAQEIKLRHEFADRQFTLIGKADRVDIDDDGRMVLYDYKSGAIPREKDILNHAKQIPLLSKLLEIEGLPDRNPAPVKKAGYIEVGSRTRNVIVDRFSAELADGNDFYTDTWEKFQLLIDKYRDPETGYTSHLGRVVYADYDHLARFGEWDETVMPAECSGWDSRMNRFDDATWPQIQAANPDISSWVSANAGSGKTKVLTDRVARLLLAGTPPSNILCLTFTKAAAANMQVRLFEKLGTWSLLPEAELREVLFGLGETEETLTAQKFQRARTLFAQALETPGGLKIQTIHAFSSALLRKFPREAGVSPQFKEIDERGAKRLQNAVLETVATEHPEIFDEFAELAKGRVLEVVDEILEHRKLFGETESEAAVWKAFGLPECFESRDLARELFETPELRNAGASPYRACRHAVEHERQGPEIH